MLWLDQKKNQIYFKYIKTKKNINYINNIYNVPGNVIIAFKFTGVYFKSKLTLNAPWHLEKYPEPTSSPSYNSHFDVVKTNQKSKSQNGKKLDGHLIKILLGRERWLKPVIPALWEAEAGRSRGQEIKTILVNMVKPRLY